MDNFKENVSKYIEKNKKSKLNKSEIAKIVNILKIAIIHDNQLTSDVTNVLLELHYSVTAAFFKTVFPMLDSSVKENMITQFLYADKIVKNTRNFAIQRSLIIINELLQTEGNNEFIHRVLKDCIKKFSGKDVGIKAAEMLSQICIDDTKDKIFLLDYSNWTDSELRKLSFWFAAAAERNNHQSVHDVYATFVETYHLPQTNRPDTFNKTERNTEQEKTSFGTPIEDNARVGMKPKDKINKLLHDLQQELNKMLNEVPRLEKDLEEIKARLDHSEKNKRELDIQLTDVRNRNEQLRKDLMAKEHDIVEWENIAADLDERLKNSFNADSIQQNQELAALKNELAKLLKLDYEDYIKLASKEPAPQYYEALVIVVENIFKTLRRKGITFAEEEV